MEWDTLKEEDGLMKVEEVLVTLTEEEDVNELMKQHSENQPNAASGPITERKAEDGCDDELAERGGTDGSRAGCNRHK